jgi:hypothetical protein
MQVDSMESALYNRSCALKRGCSSMAELQLPKLTARVRFPSPAPTSKIAFIAQSVERIHGKDEVIGSIPIKGSKSKRDSR